MGITAGSDDRNSRGSGSGGGGGGGDRSKGKRRAAPRRRRVPGTSVSRNNARRLLRLSIPSDFVAGREAQEKVLHEVSQNGYHGQSLFAIKLALEEALINAIKHGNKLDPAKQVRIEAKISPRQAEIAIEDQGAGFDRCGVPDPTLEENLHKCSGRGILLIEAYMDRVEYSKGGRRLRMVKKNQE